jgi:hypothetical protein
VARANPSSFAGGHATTGWLLADVAAAISPDLSAHNRAVPVRQKPIAFQNVNGRIAAPASLRPLAKPRAARDKPVA